MSRYNFIHHRGIFQENRANRASISREFGEIYLGRRSLQDHDFRGWTRTGVYQGVWRLVSVVARLWWARGEVASAGFAFELYLSGEIIIMRVSEDSGVRKTLERIRSEDL